MTSPDSPKSASTALDAAMKEILAPDSPYAFSTFTGIKRSLKQFHIASRVEVYDVLNEAYLRGQEYIRAGNTIRIPHAWLKKTCFNIVRERYRALGRQQLIDPDLYDQLPLSKMTTQIELNDGLPAVIKALVTLAEKDPESAQIIIWKWVEDYSWREICQRLRQQGGGDISEATLRQRGARAKKELRRLFHAQESSNPC